MADTTYIYADNAATTPLSPRALEAMMPYLTDRYGNPSGIHRVSREAARALAAARERMAELLGAENPDEIVFTSGGTESDNWVLTGSVERWYRQQEQDKKNPCYERRAEAASPAGTCAPAAGAETPRSGNAPGNAPSAILREPKANDALHCAQAPGATCADVPCEAAAGSDGSAHPAGPNATPAAAACAAAQRPLLVTSAIEHHAMLHTCAALAHRGAETVYLPVDAQGHVNVADLERALSGNEDRTALVSVMLANNEIGTIEDVKALAAAAHAHGVRFHTDAVQAVGHIPVNVQELGVDALSLSAHKFHGPRGVGALYLKRGFDLPPFIHGGAQERNLRAGTENLAGIVGMVASLEEQLEGLAAAQKRTAALRDRIAAEVCAAVPGVHLTGDPERRLPSIASFACENIDGELAVVILDQLGVAAATGSACSTGSTDPSHVVAAIGAPAETLHGTLRLSISDRTTDEEAALIAQRTVEALQRARNLSAMVRPRA